MTHPYPDVIVHAADDKEIWVVITYRDAGTTGHATIILPDGESTEIEDAGSRMIGKAKDLRGDYITITSSVDNLEPNIKNFQEKITVAGIVAAEYDKPKTDDPDPQIEVFVKIEK